MIYTSGATAEPKAVVHTHGAQIRHAWSLAQLYGFTEDVRTFTTMPFFWVGGLTVCLLSHLHVGAAVITVERMDPPAMVELIERERATRLVGWTLLDRITADPALADRDLSWLVEIEASGAAPDPGLRHNSLGMSETCGPHTAAAAAEKEVDLPERLRGSFGPPVPGVQHKVVDPENPSVELPDGVEGDLLVRGYSLMDGLYKKERSETFDDDGWYRTGDKGFFRDSYLFFTGRSTEMIKTGGANVAPREVELAIESLAGRPSRLRRRPARREARSAGGLPRLSGAGHRDRSHRARPGGSGISCRRTKSRAWSRSSPTKRRHGCRRGRSASPAWSTCSQILMESVPPSGSPRVTE